MRWLLLVLLTIAGCSAPVPPPATPTPTSAAKWNVTFGEANRAVGVDADGKVRSEGKVVGNIPPEGLKAFESAVEAPDLVALKQEAPAGEHVTTLAYYSGSTERRWSWPTTTSELPPPLAKAVDELEKAQASMVPVEGP